MIMERLEQNEGLFGEEATEQIKDSYRERGIEVTVSTTFFSLARSVLLGFVLALPIAYSYRTVSVNQN
jgi:spermidine synthase